MNCINHYRPLYIEWSLLGPVSAFLLSLDLPGGPGRLSIFAVLLSISQFTRPPPASLSVCGGYLWWMASMAGRQLDTHIRRVRCTAVAFSQLPEMEVALLPCAPGIDSLRPWRRSQGCSTLPVPLRPRLWKPCLNAGAYSGASLHGGRRTGHSVPTSSSSRSARVGAQVFRAAGGFAASTLRVSPLCVATCR